jgi:hypothetical protein
LDLLFQHAPTVYENVEFSDAVPGTDLYTNVTVSDLDGLEQVICAYNLYGEDGSLLTQSVVQAGPEGVFSNKLTYRYPVAISLSNSTLAVNITCMDELSQPFYFNASLEVGPSPNCLDCEANGSADQRPTSEVETSNRGRLIGAGALIVLAACVGWILRRRSDADDEPAWGEEEGLNPLLNTENLFDEDAASDVFDSDETAEETQATTDIVPHGWTVEEFTTWLGGPVPEGWTPSQWAAYVETSTAALSAQNQPAEG